MHVIFLLSLYQLVVHAVDGHRVSEVMGHVQVVDGVIHPVLAAGKVGKQLIVHDAVGYRRHLGGVLQVVAGRVGAAQVQVSRCGGVVNSGMYLEFALPADGLDGIVLGTLVIATGGAVLGAAEVIGHYILGLNFLNGKVDGSIDIVQGTVLLLLVDAIKATQFAQADDLVVLVIQLLEQVEGLAVFAGTQGLGTDDLALV